MISVILTIHGNDKERSVNFLCLLACIKQQLYKDYELIIVEQCCNSSPVWSMLNRVVECRYYTLYDGTFSWEWLRNFGARKAKYSTILFLDADVVFGINYFDILLSNYNGVYSIGWDKSYWLNKNGKDKYLSGLQYIKDWRDVLCDKIGTPNGGAGWGLANLFDKSFFLDELGGYCEDYCNWGGGDWEIEARVKYLTNDNQVTPYSIIHLWHSKKARHFIYGDDFVCITKNNPDSIISLLLSRGVGIESGRTIIGMKDLLNV